MSALVGYTGEPDPRLDSALLAPLGHRHSGPVHEIGTTYGQLLWAGDSFSGSGAANGLASDGDVILGVAGELDSSPSDLLDGYKRWGVKSLLGMQGTYVLAILDHGTLFLARDVAGMRSLYVTKHEGRRFFAIEPKALWMLPGFCREIEPASVARYFTFSFQPGPRMMLRGIDELPAARAWQYDGDNRSSHRLYDHAARAKAPNGSSDGSPVADFRNHLLGAVARGLNLGRPVAATLSGGLDSSLIAALVAQEHPQRLQTYSLHFGKNLPNELEFARIVAKHIGSDHEEIELRPRNIVSRLSELVMLMDDPIGDPVTLGNYALARQISTDHPVVFNGEGGDPCFGGPKTIPMMMHHWYGSPDRMPDWRERAYLKSYRRAYEELPRLLHKPYRDPDGEMIAILRPYFNRDHRLLLRSLLEINIRLKGASLILPKVERIQRSAGLLPQSPLFDPTMVDASMTLPTSWILQRGIDKVILRCVAEGLVPQEIIQRPKSGMRVPVHYWFQGDLKKLARKLLSRRRLRRSGIFQPDRAQEILRFDTEEASSRYGLWLWMMTTFEMWRSIVIDGECDW